MGIGRGMRRRSFASEGRFGEAEPEGCASIRERVDACRMWTNLFSSRDVRDVREVFWKGSTAFAYFAYFARDIDSHPFRVFRRSVLLYADFDVRCSRNEAHIHNALAGGVFADLPVLDLHALDGIL